MQPSTAAAPPGELEIARRSLCFESLARKPSGAQFKVQAYVDGFNLYYGAVKGTPFKWLNPVLLSRLLLPSTFAIDKLRYFTAACQGFLILMRQPASRYT